MFSWLLLLVTVAVLAVRGRELRMSAGADGVVRGVCGALRFAEYSGFFHSAGDGGGAVGASLRDSLADSFSRMTAVEGRDCEVTCGRLLRCSSPWRSLRMAGGLDPAC